MNQGENTVSRGINAIDSVVSTGLAWMEGTPSFIRIEFMKVFARSSPELISHLLDKWDGDFAGFYLNLDEKLRRCFFEYYGFALEKDKYSDSLSLNMALINGADKFEVFPLESYTVHLFYLTAFNSPLELLGKIAPAALVRLKEYGISLYGNGLHWSQAWIILTDEEKAKLIEYIYCQ
jgi:hypothetical protein